MCSVLVGPGAVVSVYVPWFVVCLYVCLEFTTLSTQSGLKSLCSTNRANRCMQFLRQRLSIVYVHTVYLVFWATHLEVTKSLFVWFDQVGGRTVVSYLRQLSLSVCVHFLYVLSVPGHFICSALD